MTNETATENEKTTQINGSDIKPGMTVLRRIEGMGTVWVRVKSATHKQGAVVVWGTAIGKHGSWPVSYVTGANAGVIQKL